MNTDKIIESMIEYRKSDEYKKYLEHQRYCELIENKYIKKFHSLTPEERLSIIEKIITKYESDDYYWREIKKGYEPRKPLYYLLFEYGNKYGEESNEGLSDYFPEQKFIIDGHIEISIIHGQGSFIKINIL